MSNSQKVQLMIVGAQKAGTTSLKNYLAQHHQITTHPQLEFSYFNTKEKAVNYESVFEKNFPDFTSGMNQVVMAKLAGMHARPEMIEKLAQHNPNCHLLFIVRNPIKRAFSSYRMEKRLGNISEDFDGLVSMLKEDPTNKGKNPLLTSFFELGNYASHLSSMYEHFPKNQVFAIDYDELSKIPNELCSNIFKWLDLPDSAVDGSVIHNKGRQMKSQRLSKMLNYLRNPGNPLKRMVKAVLPYKTFTKLGQWMMGLNQKENESTKEVISSSSEQYLHSFYIDQHKSFEQLTGIRILKTS